MSQNGDEDMGKKGEDTKKFIREKAACLFAQKGYKNVTMKDICAITGLSRGGYIGIMIAHSRFFLKSWICL